MANISTKVEVICKFTGIKFYAPSKRTQVHPDIAFYKTQANKHGWYAVFFKIIEYGKAKKITELTQYTELLDKAARGENVLRIIDASETNPIMDFIEAVHGVEMKRSYASWCKRITELDTSIYSGFSLLGDMVDIKYFLAEDGIYIDCAATEATYTDNKKDRKALSYYTVFEVIAGKPNCLIHFLGRKLGEEIDQLKQIWALCQERGIPDTYEESKAAKAAATRKIITTRYLGNVGALILHEDKQLKILYVTKESWCEDSDGNQMAASPALLKGGKVIASTWYQYTYYLKEVEK